MTRLTTSVMRRIGRGRNSADSATDRAPGLSRIVKLLRLGFQLRIVLLQKRTNLVGHREQLLPLLLVERDRKAPEAVHRHAALLAHFQADAAPALALEP